MPKKYKISAVMRRLRNEPIKTWFDLGIFLDRVRENRPQPPLEFHGNFDEYKKKLGRGGVAFITFYYAVDGVTFEVKKYSESFKQIFSQKLPIHFIAGHIDPEAQLPKSATKHVIPEMAAFDYWPLYKDFFFHKLRRGNKKYNQLIGKFWQETLTITEKLGRYIEENNIRLLYLINTNSNPGNVSLALALVLLSEYLHLPVINNNHDFYWEGGNRKIDIKTKQLKAGPRDLFFRNADVGEFFSIIEMIYPWESRSWISTNLNQTQSRKLIEVYGYNPANVQEVGTSVDTDHLMMRDETRKVQTLKQIAKILGNNRSTLAAVNIDDYITGLPQLTDPKPVFLGLQSIPTVNIINSLIFLQPTRVIERKRIDVDIDLIKKLLNYRTFSDYFRKNNGFNIVLLVTGPIATGHTDTLENIVRRFQQLRQEIEPCFHNKIFLGFLFSAFDKPAYKRKHKQPIQMYDIYNSASLTLLPSETEGRGLPIIESAAAGVPIFCRRYYPHEAYAQVVGEHLSPEQRLATIELHRDYIGEKVVKAVTERMLHPARFKKEREHNRRIAETRYSPERLKKDIWNILHTSYKQQHPDFDVKILARQLITRSEKRLRKFDAAVKKIIPMDRHQPLTGYGKLSFMIYLKSLIDPSFFRLEEQNMRGLIMQYAKFVLERYSRSYPVSFPKKHRFFNCVDHFFTHREGSLHIRIDHSLAYRHRNRYFYPYREHTFQQLAGAVNLAFDKIIRPYHLKISDQKQASHYIPTLHQALLHLTDSYHLAIDHTDRLGERLKQNVPYAFFPEKNIVDELDVFVTRTMRGRLKLSPAQEITAEKARKAVKKGTEPVYIFINSKHAWLTYSAHALKEYITHGASNKDLKTLFEYGLCKIVPTKQASIGVDFQQLGKQALDILDEIRKKNGFVVAIGEDAAMTTDIVDLELFHIGSAQRILTSKIMGISQGSGFVEWVPRGLRPTLGYPTPVQTSKDFAEILRGETFTSLLKKLGRKKLLALLREDAALFGSPLAVSLKKITAKQQRVKEHITISHVTGVYRDGLPYSGVMARIDQAGTKAWNFEVVYTKDKPQPAQRFLKEFDDRISGRARVAWNGGYLLNAELIGKLGLQHSYIGSPLGLVTAGGKIIAAPLFNKPAILFYKNGQIKIKRVNCRKGLIIADPKNPGQRVVFRADAYNRKNSNGNPGYYDLMYNEGRIPADGRIMCRLSGNVIKDVIKSKKGQSIRHLPIGLTLAFPKKLFPAWMRKDREIKIVMKEFADVEHAIEAGPLLIRSGKLDIDMEREGWKTANSIATQAARIDYEDMRGPKIAAGLDKNMNLSVLVINGRIRESVGARHQDMAQILKKQGIIHAMGFDPGGSATLVVDGQTLNISPFNRDFEKDVYSLPPEPRPISNAVIGWERPDDGVDNPPQKS